MLRFLEAPAVVIDLEDPSESQNGTPLKRKRER